MGQQNRISSLGKRARMSFRGTLIAGIALLVPVAVTFIVLRIIFQWIDGLAQPLVKRIFQTENDVFGLGLVLTLILIWLAGLLAGNVFGKRLIGKGDDLIKRLPVIGSIYGPVKQFMESVVSPDEDRGFNRVVIAEYPSDGLWILGFATGDIPMDEDGRIGCCVFIPTSPNPATGWTVVFPPEKVRNVSLTVEEAMQMIVSAGVVIPDALKSTPSGEPDAPLSNLPAVAGRSE
ncbi:MAG: DUF502 domain-containing protein [Gemmatimonadota bacterium]|nr:DUF502 domain-containing protein [Gemmatimonadota bacterium]